MPEFTCPLCDTNNDLDWESMPKNACDDQEHECQHCNAEMTIGWIAEIEVRSVKTDIGDTLP